MTGVKDLGRKQHALKVAVQLAKQAGGQLNPAAQRDAVAETRRLALDLESISEDLDQLDSLTRRPQPAGALR